MSLTKSEHIARAARGKSKAFSKIFVEVDIAFKSKGFKLKATHTIAYALQVFNARMQKGRYEYALITGIEDGRGNVVYVPYETDVLKLLRIRPSTLARNLEQYKRYLGVYNAKV